MVSNKDSKKQVDEIIKVLKEEMEDYDEDSTFTPLDFNDETA